MWPLLLLSALFGVQFVLGLVAGFTSRPVPELIGPIGSGLLTLFQFVVGITMIIQCFRIRDIIQDHATPPPDPDQRFVERVQLSGLMTFFFSIFYLQWAINKYVVGGATR
jgi:TctA family transporter